VADSASGRQAESRSANVGSIPASATMCRHLLTVRQRPFQGWNVSSTLAGGTSFMIYVMGHPAKITADRVCTRSGDDHIKLKHEARADRQRLEFNVDDSFVLCLRCGQAVSLRV
jgi:hypothetical protein